MSHSQFPTYHEIAQRAGVSVFSVSCALRNVEGVSEKTRKRIQEIAEEMGYRPNPMVSALMQLQRSRRRASVKSIIAHLECHPQWFLDAIKKNGIHSTTLGPLEGAREACDQNGFVLEQFFLQDFRDNPKRFFSILRARSVSGIIFQGGDIPVDWAALPDWKDYALVSAGNRRGNIRCDFACADNHMNMWTILTRLKELGYARIGMAIRDGGWSTRDLHRYQSAYRGWHDSEGRAQLSTLSVPNAGEWSCDQFVRWVKKERFDALVSGDPVLLEFLHKAGYQVPKDIGYAYIDLDRSWKHLAGVYTDNRVTGAAAIQLLIERINHNTRGIPQHPRAVFVSGDWVMGPTVQRVD